MMINMKGPQSISKMDTRAFQCCLCCHVKTGTLFYGIFTMLLHLLVLGLLVLAAVHPDILINGNKQQIDGTVVVQTIDGNLFEKLGNPTVNKQMSRDNLCVMFVITLAWVMSVLVLLYGIARNQARYLMPYFCLQVFDFCLSSLGVVGCFVYAPNVKDLIKDQGLDAYPFFDRLMCLDPDTLILLFVTGLVLFLSVKAYLIGMVWSCYKFIQLHVASRSVLREYSVNPKSQMLLPPCYEDAIKVPTNYPNPPTYE